MLVIAGFAKGGLIRSIAVISGMVNLIRLWYPLKILDDLYDIWFLGS